MSFDNSWVLDLEPMIFSKIKADLTAKFKDKYKDLNVTRDGRIYDEPKFPTVYIQFISNYEMGHTLEGTSINAVNLLIQMNVVVNKKMGEKVAREIEIELLNYMKSMYYQTQLPEPIEVDKDDILTTIMRFTRIYGNGDKV